MHMSATEIADVRYLMRVNQFLLHNQHPPEYMDANEEAYCSSIRNEMIHFLRSIFRGFFQFLGRPLQLLKDIVTCEGKDFNAILVDFACAIKKFIFFTHTTETFRWLEDDLMNGYSIDIHTSYFDPTNTIKMQVCYRFNVFSIVELIEELKATVIVLLHDIMM